MLNDTANNPTNGLEMRWVPEVDERGRTRMAATWVLVGEPADVVHAA